MRFRCPFFLLFALIFLSRQTGHWRCTIHTLIVSHLSLPCFFGDLLLRIHHRKLIVVLFLLNFLRALFLSILLPLSDLLRGLERCSRVFLIATCLVPTERSQTFAATTLILLICNTVDLLLLGTKSNGCRLERNEVLIEFTDQIFSFLLVYF